MHDDGGGGRRADGHVPTRDDDRTRLATAISRPSQKGYYEH